MTASRLVPAPADGAPTRPSESELRALRAVCQTERQRLWAEAYVETGNRAEASRRAGYKQGSIAALSRQGARNLARPEVAAYVDALRRAASGDPRTRLQQVADRLWQIGSGGSVEQLIRGELRIVPARASSQIRALEVLAKMLGGLDAKLHVTLAPTLRAELHALRARMPEESFVALLTALESLAADTVSAGALPADVVDAELAEDDEP